MAQMIQANKQVRVPEPRVYTGTRDAQVLKGKGLWHIPPYLSMLRLSEEAKAQMAAMYLDADAKLWWKTKVEEMDCGRCSIRSWQELKAELKALFMPGNVSWMGFAGTVQSEAGAVRHECKSSRY